MWECSEWEGRRDPTKGVGGGIIVVFLWYQYQWYLHLVKWREGEGGELQTRGVGGRVWKGLTICAN